MSPHPLSSIPDILEEAKAGRMFIIVDDENRENEGDLIIPAQMATPEVINFMAKYCRGLICLALTQERVRQLQLSMMSRENGTPYQTAFTVSIEAREGITTGISAADRAQTISVAIDPKKNAQDIISPGHIFPVVAREGGVLVRAGHTEAAVDIARMAGLIPAGVICEIMNEDGTMARLPNLIDFAKTHNLKIATIADLIAYRRRHERIIQKITETKIFSRFGGEFQLYVYNDTLEYTEHVVLVKGKIDASRPTLVRVHPMNFLPDILGDSFDQKDGHLHYAMEYIAEQGNGVIVIIRDIRKNALTETINSRNQPNHAIKTADFREYGIGAQILLDLGIHEMELITNSKHMLVGLEGYGLKISGYHPIPQNVRE